MDVGVRAQSLGGAIRAQGGSNDVIYYNPAALIKKRRLGPEAEYLIGSQNEGHIFGVSVVDSSTSTWGVGLAYNTHFFPDSDTSSSHSFYVASTIPLGTDWLTLGSSFSYVYDKNLGPAPYKHFLNGDIALMANIPIGFSLAIVADHIWKAKGREKSLGLSVGSAFDFGVLLPLPLTLSFDWTMNDATSDGDLDHVLSAGAEFILLSVLPLRAGFKSSIKENKKVVSLGSGLILGMFEADVLYSQDVLVGKNRQFGFALRTHI